MRAGDRRKHDFGSRYCEIGPVMLADAECIDAESVGEDRFIDQIADDLCVGLRPSVGSGGDVAKSVQPELKLVCHDASRKHDPAR